MFQNYNILKKVTFLIKSKKHESLTAWIFTKYNNISIFPEGDYLKVELFLNNSIVKNKGKKKTHLKELNKFKICGGQYLGKNSQKLFTWLVTTMMLGAGAIISESII